MMSKTHLAFGVLVGLFFATLLDVDNKFIFVSIAVIASLIPDLDMPASKLGQKVRPLSWFLNLLFGHRGLIHTIFFPLVIWGVLVHYNKHFIAAPFFLGYMSHLVIDMLTVQGIYFFYPISKVKVNGFVKTGGVLEWFIFVAILAGIVWILV